MRNQSRFLLNGNFLDSVLRVGSFIVRFIDARYFKLRRKITLNLNELNMNTVELSPLVSFEMVLDFSLISVS